MLELRLVQGSLLKNVLEFMNELINVVNFKCSSTGFSIEGTDSSHVALVALLLRPEGFEHYCCDRNISKGMNLKSIAKMLKCTDDDDIVTIKADDRGDTFNFMFESQNKISVFKMKLMDIDSQQHLWMSEEAEYHAIVKMPSSEFVRICRDLSKIGGDSVVILVTKEAVKFSTKGKGLVKSAIIVCSQNTSVDKPEEATVIDMNEPMSVTIALDYMKSFTKATLLSNTVVSISLSNELPVLVEYKIAEIGYLRFVSMCSP